MVGGRKETGAQKKEASPFPAFIGRPGKHPNPLTKVLEAFPHPNGIQPNVRCGLLLLAITGDEWNLNARSVLKGQYRGKMNGIQRSETCA